jgi:hypothetical protein
MDEMEVMDKFMEMMCAGLAVEAREVKVATLSGLALIYGGKFEIPIEFSLEVLGIVLILIYEERS